MKRFAQQLVADLPPLWVAGLAVLQNPPAKLDAPPLPPEGGALRVGPVFAAGAVFPILVLLLRPTPLVQTILALGSVLSILLLYRQDFAPCLVLGSSQVLLLLVLLRQRLGWQEISRVFPSQASGIVMGVVVAVLCWLVVCRWVW